MDAYPTIDELTDGMQMGSTTDLWDIVVSFSVDKLNHLLLTVWAADSTASNVRLTTTGLDPYGETYYIDWVLTLGSPSLAFTLDSRASLTMSLSGTHQVQPVDGKELPVIDIPEGSYVFNAIIPLVSVSAVEGDTTGSNASTSGEVISFGDDSNAKIHIVFQFTTSTLGSCSIDYTGSGSDPSGDMFAVGLRATLAAWLADPLNISFINYSLAIIDQTPSTGALYLTPESLSFTVYSSGDVGCLSVYIKTKESGNDVGNITRAFRLPNASGKNTYPIPQGYDASIIIRHELFESCLKQALESTPYFWLQKAFSDVATQPTNSGFKLLLTLNDADLILPDPSDPFFQIKSRDWSLSKTPATLVITPDGSSQWSMTSKGHIVFSNGFPDPYTVKCTCTLTLDQKTRIMQVDQHTINASLGVTASSWHKNNDANLGVVTEWLEQWASMAFSHDLQVDFFATTNIFAPGKQVINIDTKRGLLAPYDVLLMGDVKDNASLSEV